MSAETWQVKVVLLGCPNVGKSELCARLGGVAAPTDVANITSVVMQTSAGSVQINVWDGVLSEEGVGVELALLADGAIIMFDVTDQESYNRVPDYYRRIMALDTVPCVLVGNKVDDPNRVVKPKNITFHRKKNLQYYDVSASTGYNVTKPFLWLLRKITSNPDLHFLE